MVQDVQVSGYGGEGVGCRGESAGAHRPQAGRLRFFLRVHRLHEGLYFRHWRFLVLLAVVVIIFSYGSDLGSGSWLLRGFLRPLAFHPHLVAGAAVPLVPIDGTSLGIPVFVLLWLLAFVVGLARWVYVFVAHGTLFPPVNFDGFAAVDLS